MACRVAYTAAHTAANCKLTLRNENVFSSTYLVCYKQSETLKLPWFILKNHLDSSIQLQLKNNPFLRNQQNWNFSLYWDYLASIGVRGVLFAPKLRKWTVLYSYKHLKWVDYIKNFFYWLRVIDSMWQHITHRLGAKRVGHVDDCLFVWYMGGYPGWYNIENRNLLAILNQSKPHFCYDIA